MIVRLLEKDENCLSSSKQEKGMQVGWKWN